MNKYELCDFHLHSDLSSDSHTPMEKMIRSGIDAGISVMCFTEHMDLHFPKQYSMDFQVDMDAYQKTFAVCQKKYAPLVDLRFGIELGIQPHLTEELQSLVNKYPFDFIIGSSHIINSIDPYYPQFWEGKTEYQAVSEYFAATLDNLETFSDFDVYGHIDYVIRYAPEKNKNYAYRTYREILDEILCTLISKHIGIEINTAGFKYGLGHPNPCEEILMRYRELGGEIITMGSDAHSHEYVGYYFPQAKEILKACGFTHYTIFKNRKPEFLPL